MRLIDADSIHYTRVLSQQGLNMELAAKVVIDDMPTIDAAPVVHCNMCRYYETDTGFCNYHGGGMDWDGFCSCGARMDGGESVASDKD